VYLKIIGIVCEIANWSGLYSAVFLVGVSSEGPDLRLRQ
jgi:hypothetical protein